MPDDEPVTDSPLGWVSKHIRRYVDSDGKSGHRWRDVDTRFEARARTATARSKPRLWRLMASIWPEYDEFQTRTTRDIPIVILERLN